MPTQLTPTSDTGGFVAQFGPCVAAAGTQAGAPAAAIKACLAQAVLQSGGGRYCVWNNPWQLQGVGDAGYVVSLVAIEDPVRGGAGGYRIVSQKIAKFSSAEVAALAWFKAHRGG